MNLHPIIPGLYCVPSALYALTGHDPESVLFPALNRHGDGRALHQEVSGASIRAALAVLQELNYCVMRYKDKKDRQEISRIEVWANRSKKFYPGFTFLVFTSTHALIIKDGRVFDNWSPHGPSGKDHPFAKTRVSEVYLVKEK